MTNDQNTIIDDHRNMLMVSKKMSTFQITQLEMWGFIVFDDIKSIKVKYNFDDGEVINQGSVEYIFNFKGEAPTGLIKDKGLESLTNWTKSIFWADTKVKFKIGNKVWK